MKPSTQPPDLKDEDIRALLDAQQPASSPADLDARILAAAKADIQSSATEKPLPASTISRYGSWLAVAAVAVLAVILVPVMQQSNEVGGVAEPLGGSLNDSPMPTASVTTTEVLDNAEETVALERTRQLKQQESAANAGRSDLVFSESASADAVAPTRTTVPTAALKSNARVKESAAFVDKPSVEGSADENKRGLAGGSLPLTASPESGVLAEDIRDIDAMTDDEIRQTFQSHPYRRDRESWLNEISRLERLKESAQVVRERRLFERMYPGER